MTLDAFSAGCESLLRRRRRLHADRSSGLHPQLDFCHADPAYGLIRSGMVGLMSDCYSCDQNAAAKLPTRERVWDDGTTWRLALAFDSSLPVGYVWSHGVMCSDYMNWRATKRR
jgi:hypothetical protein